MGKKNYLIEGVSCTGKTSVCSALEARGYHALNGDRVLAYCGDPTTGAPLDHVGHDTHIWDVNKVKELAEDPQHCATFFCGGSRNFNKFIHLFDKVFVLEIDLATLNKRLSERPTDDWGGHESERELIRQLHANGGDVPASGTRIDATAPIQQVVDQILAHCGLSRRL
ncbi:AAA family ATPase [Maritalea porphyrae]|uniref:Nucleoside kinase n=1 Tax=Maritalea porphyrae TaxID=880732 RepID=A0ABQ5UTT7_9HYPH|nr:nucleoside kinase [Maritalea porphyrae]GLQ17377.1 nucleoside kinase [Maritalea porphyrae]